MTSRKPNLEKDSWFLDRIQKKELKVYRNGKIKNLKTGRYIGSKSGSYIYISMQDPKTKKIRTILAHRLIYAYFERPLKEDEEINHIDFDGTNNNFKNLEATDRCGNMSHSFNGDRKNMGFQKGNTYHSLRESVGNRYGTFRS